VSAIAIKSVTKRYRDGTVAVNGIDLEIADGELMILVGPSGCGKTTLLRMIAGLEEITSGQIVIGDRVVNDLTPRERDVAMVFQNYALYPHMTVAKNMGFALRRAGTPAEEIKRRVQETAKLLGIAEHLERKPANLSGGQRQRVAMGRAIVRDPQVFLMDEPLSNLDAKLRIQMRAEILRIQRRLKTTMVYVTHDQTEAMTLGDRVAVMRSGVVQQVGTPHELYDHPGNVFVAGFIGSPGMNFVSGEISDGEVLTPLARIPLTMLPQQTAGAVRPGPVVVGIRAEDFTDERRMGDHVRSVPCRATIDVLESTGSDIFAHLTVERAAATNSGDGATARAAVASAVSAAGMDADADVPADVVARLAAGSRVAEGQEAELWMDAARLHLFDPVDGVRVGP